MDFCTSPFGLPETEPKSKDVNQILMISYNCQKRERMTNACAIVCIILHRMLEAIGVKSEIVYGTLDLGYIKLPHVWIEINGHTIDNTFVEDVPEEFLIKGKSGVHTKYVKCLEKDDRMFFGDELTRSHGIDDHNIDQFHWMLGHPDLTLALGMNKLQIKSYLNKMTTFIENKHKKQMRGISDKANTTCWHCGREDQKLFKCGTCKVAKYCDKKCQKEAWKTNHKYLCILPNVW